jgi:hypothetical protein
MFSETKSISLFVSVCMPIRILIAMVPLYIRTDNLPYYGALLLMFAFGFLYLYFNNLRLNASEGSGTTWWANYRLLHGLLYLTAAIYSFQEKIIAALPLAIDVGLGLILFIFRHFITIKFM